MDQIAWTRKGTETDTCQIQTHFILHSQNILGDAGTVPEPGGGGATWKRSDHTPILSHNHLLTTPSELPKDNKIEPVTYITYIGWDPIDELADAEFLNGALDEFGIGSPNKTISIILEKTQSLMTNTPHTTLKTRRKLENMGFLDEEYKTVKQFRKEDFITSVLVKLDLKKSAKNGQEKDEG